MTTELTYARVSRLREFDDLGFSMSKYVLHIGSRFMAVILTPDYA